MPWREEFFERDGTREGVGRKGAHHVCIVARRTLAEGPLPVFWGGGEDLSC